MIETSFNIGERVIIDDDSSIVGTITAILLRGSGLNISYEVSYIHCGVSYSPWIEQWRLRSWDA